MELATIFQPEWKQLDLRSRLEKQFCTFNIHPITFNLFCKGLSLSTSTHSDCLGINPQQ